MLTRAGLRDHARLAHPLREQRLAQDVVDFVRAGVRKVLALEEKPRSPGVLTEVTRLGHGRRASGVGREETVELGTELRVVARARPGRGELVERGDECLGDEATAVRPEVTGVVRHGPGRAAGHDGAPDPVAGWAPTVTSSATADRGSRSVTSPSPTSTASAPQEA